MFCRKCGKDLPEGAAFCGACGGAVTESSQKKNLGWIVAVIVLSMAVLAASIFIAVDKLGDVLSKTAGADDTEKKTTKSTTIDGSGTTTTSTTIDGNGTTTTSTTTAGGNAFQKSVFSIRDEEGKTYITEAHIREIELAYDEESELPVLYFRFTDEGAELFAKATRENIGKTLGIYVENEMITNPQVREEILGGEMTLSGSDDIEELFDTLQNVLGDEQAKNTIPEPKLWLMNDEGGYLFGDETISDRHITNVVLYAEEGRIGIELTDGGKMLILFASTTYQGRSLGFYDQEGVVDTFLKWEIQEDGNFSFVPQNDPERIYNHLKSLIE